MKSRKMKIGELNFNTKKAAIEFYRNILNKYDANTSVDDEDFSYLIDLLNYNSDNNETATNEENKAEDEDNESLEEIDDIYVDYHPVYKKVKCFYAVFGEEEWLFSYLLAINGGLSDEKKFYISCRNSVKEILRNFKIEMFKNKPVKCAITKNILDWENCQVDHKAPMTFSVIVKTFLKSNNIEVSDIDLSYEGSIWHFSDKQFETEFVEYHNKVALLRIISSEENQKLASKARIKPTKNDFTVG
ncbi:MAG: DCL family protein [Methylovulum sp.]|jgi:hypothetical protein|nr:DCL family protein [Methylovulum sp.]